MNNKYCSLTTFKDYEFEEPRENCIVCGSKKIVYWDKVRSMPIVRCTCCGVKFVNPLPSDKCIRKLYDGGLLRWSSIVEYEQNRKKYFIFYLKWLKDANPHGKKLLDIGCGIGTFMKMALIIWVGYLLGWRFKNRYRYCSEKGFKSYTHRQS